MASDLTYPHAVVAIYLKSGAIIRVKAKEFHVTPTPSGGVKSYRYESAQPSVALFCLDADSIDAIMQEEWVTVRNQ